MVKLNDEQLEKLDKFQLLAEERHTLKRVAEEEAERARYRVRSAWEARMTAAVTDLKREGVPNRRIGLAWGTKNQADAKRIVERFGPTPDTPHQAKNEIDGSEEN